MSTAWVLPKKAPHKPANFNLKTRDLLRGMGYRAEITQYFNHLLNKSFDLLGFGDLLAFNPQNKETILVQACGTGDRLKRIRKILESELAAAWVRPEAGRLIWVVHWDRPTKAGERVGRWRYGVSEILPEDF